MKSFLPLIAIIVSSCVTARLPSGAQINSMGGEIAYEHLADGTERLVTQHDKAFAVVGDVVETVADTVTTGGVAKVLGKEREITSRNKEAHITARAANARKPIITTPVETETGAVLTPVVTQPQPAIVPGN